MSRKKSFANQVRTGFDHIYGSELVFKLINSIMLDGKKAIAESIVYEAMDIIRLETKENPLTILETAFENIRPLIEVRSKRIGGATYQIPTDVRTLRSYSLARRWVVASSRARKELGKNRDFKVMSFRLANEIMAGFKFEGNSYKKKENLIKVADANRAFSHFANR